MKDKLIEQFRRLAMGRLDAADALAEMLAPKSAKAEPEPAEKVAEQPAETLAKPVAKKKAKTA